VVNAAEEVVKKKVPPKKKPWFTEEISNLMDERRRMKSNPLLYQELNEKIQELCKKAKEDWMEEQCKEIECLERNHAHRTLHQKIKEVTNRRKGFTSGGGIVDKMETFCMKWKT